jgi:gliding motility-associated-like protein
MNNRTLFIKIKTMLLVLSCFGGLPLYAQTISNSGHEFWAVFPTHMQDVDQSGTPLPANFSIFLTGTKSSSGSVSAGSFSTRFNITSNQVTEIQIPRNSAYIDETESGQVLQNRAIHIMTDPEQPAIVVYAHIFAGHRSAASLILPKEALGQQYLSINFNQHDTEGKNFIVVTATEANTKIHLLKGNTELVPGGIVLPNINDAYEYLSNEDLTGVSVYVDQQTSACNHIAVFSGSSGIYIAPKNCTPASLDPLFQQCLTIESWGYQYGFIPFSMNSAGLNHPVRTAGNFVRVLAKEDNTLVKINNTTITLGKGAYYTSPEPITNASIIVANHPVCVAQYALSQSCSGQSNSYSDPDMVILNPIEYRIKDITVYSSTRENISEQYLNIFISEQAAASFKINGVVPSQPFLPLKTFPGYVYLQFQLPKSTSNTFHLTANEGFNAVAYGFGNVESYAYSAGTNLAGTQFLSAYTSGTDIPIDSACADDNYYFKLTLPYQSARLSWQLDKNEQSTIQPSPPARKVLINGIPSYEYRLPKTPAYKISGMHEISIISDYPLTIGQCSNGAQQIKGSFLVLAVPAAGFTYKATGCAYNLLFTDTTKESPSAISTRIWDFGDPASGTDANTAFVKGPEHIFSRSGTFTVTLLVTNAAGCQSTFFSKIKVDKAIVPSFTNTSQGCVAEPSFFYDNSIDKGFGTQKRLWFFGDGDSVSTVDNVMIKHIYKSGGVYKIKLILENANGCVSDSAISSITILNKVFSHFTVPDVCLSNPQAHFVNLSIGYGYNAHSISYVWDFGDPFATAANPNISILNEGYHTYLHAGTYTVTLVSLTDNCTDTLRQQITVSDGAPKAAFNIAGTSVCSGSPLKLTDNSQPPLNGKITRLVWYFDASDNRNNSLIVNEPEPGGVYYTTYTLPQNISDNRTFTISLLAYSGTSCVDSVSKELQVMGLPEIRFDSIPPICVNASHYTVSQAYEANGEKGTGTYSGVGVTALGVFDPGAAGLGIHPITYQFISSSGCQATKVKTITVIPPPKVTGSQPVYVAQGSSIKLHPVYTGVALQYAWQQAPGLKDITDPYPVISPTETTTYRVSVSSGGCSDDGEITVKVQKPIVTASAFSPNNDGVNDTWKIGNLEDYPESSVEIFNRYGVSLFYSKGYKNPWNGTYHGAIVPSATYYYIIKLGAGQPPVSGNVTVLR